MRKQTKIAAVVSAAALLALGASITSFAASKGTWMMTDGEWYCYDKNGDVYTNTFCSSNGKEYYVGDDGAIVTSSWVDYDGSKYFVNSSGAKVTNDWRLTTPMDDENAEEQWFYFQSTGKMAENKKILYNGKTYYFDADGKMLTGWVTADGTNVVNEENSVDTDKTFYCDETGARVENNWVYTTAPATADNDADADEYWYFLKKSSGKVATGKQNNVKGQTYIFGNTGDNRGQLLTGWVGGTLNDDDKYEYEEIGGETDAKALTAVNVAYFAPYGGDFDGHVKKNQWINTWRPTKYYEEDEDVSKKYFYLEKDGKVFVPETVIAAAYKFKLEDGAMIQDGGQFDMSKKKIGSKDYFFTEEGEMVTGFVKTVAVTADSGLAADSMYYLGGSTDGSMKTGAITVKDDNGDAFKFYFGTKTNDNTGEVKGAGITGNKSNKLYYEGHLVAASDYKYQVAEVNGVKFIVNQNGSIQHSSVQYKEDGDILIDAKGVTKFVAAGINKYAVEEGNLDYNSSVELNPEDIMAVSDAVYSQSNSALGTPSNQ